MHNKPSDGTAADFSEIQNCIKTRFQCSMPQTTAPPYLIYRPAKLQTNKLRGMLFKK